MGQGGISDAVAFAAVEAVLKPLGTSLRHYMPVSKADAVKAMRAVLEAAIENAQPTIPHQGTIGK